MRFLLDVCIGRNDGPAFFAPSDEGRNLRVITDMEILEGKEVPDWVMALETNALDDPNATLAVLCLGFHYAPLAERPTKLVLCRWPGDFPTRWNWRFEPINEPEERPADSCAVIYWTERSMKPGEQRVPAFSYGLGRSDGW